MPKIIHSSWYSIKCRAAAWLKFLGIFKWLRRDKQRKRNFKIYDFITEWNEFLLASFIQLGGLDLWYILQDCKSINEHCFKLIACAKYMPDPTIIFWN